MYMKLKSILLKEEIHDEARLYCVEKGLVLKTFIERLVKKELDLLKTKVGDKDEKLIISSRSGKE